MAAAIKCDRCGSYYDQNENRAFDASRKASVVVIGDEHNILCRRFDLCDSCIEELAKFLKVKGEDE